MNDDTKDDYPKLEKTREDLREDSRKYLGHLFTHTDGYRKNSISEIKKLFPGKHAKVDKEGGGQFLKLAQYTYGYSMKHTPLVKSASPSFQQVMFFSFRDELEKIAGYSTGIGSRASALMKSKAPLPAARIQQRQRMRAQIPPRVHDVSNLAQQMGV